ncbi:hypothetical protein RND81_04G071500 [Saponaria officinalis]|uniref:Replication factor A C-terminal domain-containing protein n=1 Tax=Saponaria officinalis TaxID=3572 RepID=A0AAW1LDF1_SAPOF
MKPRSVYLDELTNTSKNYKVKVRVLEKRRPRTSPGKVGSKMRGALFNDQVSIYEDAIKPHKIYEITNAPISPVKPEYKSNPTDLDYQITFNHRTILQPVDIDDAPAIINYQPISGLPRATDYSEMFDIVGIVLFVEEHSRKIMTAKKRECNVREIMLAEDDCTMLTTVPGQFKIVGLTALRVSNYKCFSMTTSSSTIIIHSPIGEKAEALSAWMTNHQTALAQLQSRIYHIKMPLLVIKTTKISALRSKKAKSTLQDEKHWLEVAIPNAELHKINAYMRCSKCAKRSGIPPGHTYTCSACSKPDCTTTPKITFSCDISDGTGTLPMTTFTSTAEQLFKMSASDIYHMKHSHLNIYLSVLQDDDKAFTAVQELLRVTTFKVQVGPAKSLSINNILQWEVKDSVFNGEDGKPYKNESIQKATTPSQECKTMINSIIADSVNDDNITPPDVTQQVPKDASTVIYSTQLNSPGDSLQKMSQETASPNIQTGKKLKEKAKKDETDSPLTLHT